MPLPQAFRTKYRRPPAARFRARTTSAALLPKPGRLEARGCYRIFAAADYRFYRSATRPPRESDTPFATSATLPATPADTFADGTWYLSVSYFNGIVDSGFLPLGPAGETYLLLTVADGEATAAAPAGPLEWRIEQVAGGVVRVLALAIVPTPAPEFAQQWAIAHTANSSVPAADTPTVTAEMSNGAGSLVVLSQHLPAAANGATVKVRLQIRRNDGTEEEPVWTYSTGSEVKQIVVAAVGPSAPLAGDRWSGQLPVES